MLVHCIRFIEIYEYAQWIHACGISMAHTQREKKMHTNENRRVIDNKRNIYDKKNYECINCIIVENELDVQWCVICTKGLMWNYKP